MISRASRSSIFAAGGGVARQVIPEAWITESTRPYSHADWGPGYGYMWWTAPIESDIAPLVRLPEGTFFAAGYGGQFAFVIPSHDLVIVHRAPHAAGGPTLREIARLLWLLLDSHDVPGIGEDASIDAARLPRVGGEMISKLLAGKTLLYGEKAAQGPRRIRLGADGAFTAVRGADAVETGHRHMERSR